MKKLVAFSLAVAAMALAESQTARKLTYVPTALALHNAPGIRMDAGDNGTDDLIRTTCENLWADGGLGMDNAYSPFFSTRDYPPGSLGGKYSSTGWRLRRIQINTYPMDGGNYTHCIGTASCTYFTTLVVAEMPDAGPGTGGNSPMWSRPGNWRFQDPDFSSTANIIVSSFPSINCSTGAPATRSINWDTVLDTTVPQLFCALPASLSGGCNANGIDGFKTNVRRVYEAIQP